jgi:hypothetical protein
VARAAARDADPGPDVARAGRGDPGRHGARIEWLFEWWKTLDAWVGERRQASSTATLAEAGRVR